MSAPTLARVLSTRISLVHAVLFLALACSDDGMDADALTAEPTASTDATNSMPANTAPLEPAPSSEPSTAVSTMPIAEGGAGGDSDSVNLGGASAGGSFEMAMGGADAGGEAGLPEGFVALFDGKTLNGWKANRMNEAPGGVPVEELFTVDDVGIHVYATAPDKSNQARGTLVSDKDYSNFILEFEYKWGTKRYGERAETFRDAGVLFHVTGNLAKVWPACLEMQMGTSPLGGQWITGDLFQLGGASALLNGKRGGRGLTQVLAEKPVGEWNQLRLSVEGSKSATFELNNQVLLDGLSAFQVDGKELSKGRIAIQAEWAELWYRNIRIKER